MINNGSGVLSESLHHDQPLMVIASNRGPFSFSSNKDGSFTAKRGVGGLVTALGALAEKHDVLWIAVALSRGDRQWAARHNHEPQQVEGIRLRLLIPKRKKLYEQYYNEISNPLLWFIQHQLWDTPRAPSIRAGTWKAWDEGYRGINQQFAEAIADVVEDSQRPVIILPQDYHLYLVPRFLRQRLGQEVQI